MRKHVGKKRGKKASKHSVRLEPTLKHAGHKKGGRKRSRRK